MLFVEFLVAGTVKVVKWHVKYLSTIDGEPTRAIDEVGFNDQPFVTTCKYRVLSRVCIVLVLLMSLQWKVVTVTRLSSC